jgi:hypothetical protein
MVAGRSRKGIKRRRENEGERNGLTERERDGAFERSVNCVG